MKGGTGSSSRKDSADQDTGAELYLPELAARLGLSLFLHTAHSARNLPESPRQGQDMGLNLGTCKAAEPTLHMLAALSPRHVCPGELNRSSSQVSTAEQRMRWELYQL